MAGKTNVSAPNGTKAFRLTFQIMGYLSLRLVGNVSPGSGKSANQAYQRSESTQGTLLNSSPLFLGFSRVKHRAARHKAVF